MEKIVIENLKVVYKNKSDYVTALDGFSAILEPNSFNVVVGKSGCGKTTLLNAVAGVVDYEGKILFDDLDVYELSIQERNVSMVSQKYVLYPKMTVFDNIAYPLKVLKTPKNEIVDRVYDISERLGIKHCLGRLPKQLSGGQQQKVALARAMIKRPQLYLFDEPLSNFDPPKRAETREFIKKWVKEKPATAIYVTHDLDEAAEMADNIIVIEDGKAKPFGRNAKRIEIQ